MKSPHLIPLIVIAAVIGSITTAVVLLIDWIPPQASEQATRVNSLMWFVVWACVVIFTIVGTVLVYSAWKFRAPPGDESDGPPVHGNTTLEIIWTVVPTVLLIVMAVWAYLVLSDNEALAQDRLVVNVTAQQFAWQFQYPGTNVGSGDLRVPVGRQVELEMRSKDVIHDFYVVQFRVKEDIVPGITTHVVFNPNRVGTYQVICAELCGVGHAVMRTRVIVMPPADYEAWMARAKSDVAAMSAPATTPSTTAPAATTPAPAATTPAPAPTTTTP